MKRTKAPEWSSIEADLIFRGSEDGKTDAEIAEEINRVVGSNRTPNACYRRSVELGAKLVWTSRPPYDAVMAREYRSSARAKLLAARPNVASLQHRDITKSQDAAFQAAMRGEARLHKHMNRFHAALGGSATSKAVRPQPHFPRRWTPEEDERARAMHATGMSYREIGDRMHRSEGSVASRLQYAGIGKKIHNPGWHNFAKPTEDMKAAQRSRQDAFDARDLTGVLCGDPPVGMSALDRYNTSLVDNDMRKRVEATGDQ